MVKWSVQLKIATVNLTKIRYRTSSFSILSTLSLFCFVVHAGSSIQTGTGQSPSGLCSSIGRILSLVRSTETLSSLCALTRLSDLKFHFFRLGTSRSNARSLCLYFMPRRVLLVPSTIWPCWEQVSLSFSLMSIGITLYQRDGKLSSTHSHASDLLFSFAQIRNEDFLNHLLEEKHQETLVMLLTGKQKLEEVSDQDHEMEADTAITALEQETSEKLSSLAETVQKLNDDTVKINQEFIKLDESTQAAVQEVTNFQCAVSDRNGVMNNLQNKQQVLQKDIEQLKQSLDEHQYVSTDGTLTWRIDRVAERMADAQSDRQPSIYSPIFYSTPTGYKMRARLYLHGDGNARRTHISLFFLLMRSEYDALLPWPFGNKVTFCLFDQTGANRHIIDSFRPDTKSNSFQRPKTDANVASGIPKFFPLPMIQQDDNSYVRDDTLFLKIIVDMNETPKMLLPFMLNLNPGLPNHIQQNQINQEKSKQQATALVSNQATPINTCGWSIECWIFEFELFIVSAAIWLWLDSVRKRNQRDLLSAAENICLFAINTLKNSHAWIFLAITPQKRARCRQLYHIGELVQEKQNALGSVGSFSEVRELHFRWEHEWHTPADPLIREWNWILRLTYWCIHRPGNSWWNFSLLAENMCRMQRHQSLSYRSNQLVTRPSGEPRISGYPTSWV